MSAAFTDAEDTRTHYVYRLFGHDGVLHYIGCTYDLVARMEFHHVRLGGTMTTEEYPNRAEARAAERAAITAEAPLLNKQHNPTRFKALAGGGFVAIEPVHPLTAEMVDRENHVVTDDEVREALEKMGAALGLLGLPTVRAS